MAEVNTHENPAGNTIATVITPEMKRRGVTPEQVARELADRQASQAHTVGTRGVSVQMLNRGTAPQHHTPSAVAGQHPGALSVQMFEPPPVAPPVPGANVAPPLGAGGVLDVFGLPPGALEAAIDATTPPAHGPHAGSTIVPAGRAPSVQTQQRVRSDVGGPLVIEVRGKSVTIHAGSELAVEHVIDEASGAEAITISLTAAAEEAALAQSEAEEAAAARAEVIDALIALGGEDGFTRAEYEGMSDAALLKMQQMAIAITSRVGEMPAAMAGDDDDEDLAIVGPEEPFDAEAADKREKLIQSLIERGLDREELDGMSDGTLARIAGIEAAPDAIDRHERRKHAEAVGNGYKPPSLAEPLVPAIGMGALTVDPQSDFAKSADTSPSTDETKPEGGQS